MYMYFLFYFIPMDPFKSYKVGLYFFYIYIFFGLVFVKGGFAKQYLEQ